MGLSQIILIVFQVTPTLLGGRKIKSRPKRNMFGNTRKKSVGNRTVISTIMWKIFTSLVLSSGLNGWMLGKFKKSKVNVDVRMYSIKGHLTIT